jgi:putative SOS response-associated peptidase YedK
MPVILQREDYGLWLDPEFENRDKLLALLQPLPDDATTAVPVSTTVNSPKNDVPGCIEPLVS